ncbi:Reverse transcriptase zinc-binding domain [Sesbania bispinosa]|nr:Reverse transcriptase zinc-binding domain [Sesbania bispinosa]
MVLDTVAVGDIPNNVSDLSVAHFSRDRLNWCLHEVGHLLPESFRQEILGVPPPAASLGHDSVCWALTSNGNFSTRSAYDLVCGLDSNNTNCNVWKALWALEIPQRIKSFLWLVQKGGLKTNAKRLHCHISHSDVCPICHAASETESHILRDCIFAQGVWERILHTRPHIWHNTTVWEWLSAALLDRNHPFDLGLIAITAWSIWQTRNAYVCNHVVSRPDDDAPRVQQLLRDCYAVWARHTSISYRTSKSRAINTQGCFAFPSYSSSTLFLPVALPSSSSSTFSSILCYHLQSALPPTASSVRLNLSSLPRGSPSNCRLPSPPA